MFRPDVIELKTFYSTLLGEYVHNNITKVVNEIWPKSKNEVILGLGYPIPFIDHNLQENNRFFISMPDEQGIMHWPNKDKNTAFLSYENELPFSDNSIEKIIICHVIENSDNVRTLMRELWRVLTPQGKILLIVPNRKGLWARIERTPFYYGRPYSNGQMRELLRETMFSPISSKTALFLPPTRSKFLLNFADIWEKMGRYWIAPFGGVLIVEAEKQVYAITKNMFKKEAKSEPCISAAAWQSVGSE